MNRELLKKSQNRLVSDIDELSPKALSPYALGLDWNKLSIVPYSPLWPIIYEEKEKWFIKNI